ncbi:hypothetical protein OC835_001741 [Tilletia horrida]|nr:hypothetical protein OC835_001741 [Tilletia horrida]
MAPAQDATTTTPGLHNLTLAHGLSLTTIHALSPVPLAPAISLPALAIFLTFTLHGALAPFLFLILRTASPAHPHWRTMTAASSLASIATYALWLHLGWCLAISDHPSQLILGSTWEYATILLLYTLQHALAHLSPSCSASPQQA